ncbi:TraC family protein [Agrobacterium rhizogenes]|uniref:conjugal transfer protein TraC n=1 Tax=Rhizobium rhizogenes TaxID=359 RepID=UPI0022B61F52|nr:conjugal transfer protein TraC [Rhizobium rhizogenes]MCZ7450263.1 TraC family protein [Rhizobium rhizogenes]
MKKPSSRIREEIVKLQEQLKHTETKEAERIGRIALRAGLGEIGIEERELQAAFEDVAKRFRGNEPVTTGRKAPGEGGVGSGQSEMAASGAAAGSAGEA